LRAGAGETSFRLVDRRPAGAQDGLVHIELAVTDAQILACHPVMVQLRPHVEPAQLVERVRRQEAQGYRLAALWSEGAALACAGYRFGESLSSGRYLYVDDLVTDAAQRSIGCGDRLMAWLVERARSERCQHLLLDSGVQRHGAHRFYLRQRMDIRAYHFVLLL
jgi:GNAT superfamily N-acetyltransferase